MSYRSNYRLNPNPPANDDIRETCQRCHIASESTNIYQVLTDHGWAGCCLFCYLRHLRVLGEPTKRPR